MADTPMDALLQQLVRGAGPRGAMFAGRHIQQSEVPSIQNILARFPTEAPDAEGFGGMALAAGPIANKVIRYAAGPTKGTRGWHVSPILLDDLGNEINGKPVEILSTKKAAKALRDKLMNELQKAIDR